MTTYAPDYNRDVPGFTNVLPIIKAADETVNNSNTLQDDDDLRLYMEPYSVWRWTLDVMYTSNTTPDLQFAMLVPTGASPPVFYSISRNLTPATATTYQPYGAAGAIAVDGQGATVQVFTAWGLVVNGATAGFLQLQWAQAVANASDSKVLKGSTLMAWNLTAHMVKA